MHKVAKTHTCLKLQVIFRKRATNYRALLRKMTYEDKAPFSGRIFHPVLAKGEGTQLNITNCNEFVIFEWVIST